MTVVDVKSIWQSIQEEINSIPGEGLLERRILPNAKSNLFLAIERPSGSRMLLFHAKLGSVAKHLPFPGSRCFEVRTEEVKAKCLTIQLVLTNRDFTELFDVLIQDISSFLAEEQNDDIMARKFFERLARWKVFFDRCSPNGLGENAQQGLYGELMILRDCILPNIDKKAAISAWTGPLNEVQDFQFPSCAVEVKTTSSKQHQKLSVNSERQLDESAVPLLFVVHLSFNLSLTDGETLPDIVGNLRKSLEDNTNSLMLFNDRLLESGYLDQHSDNYSHRTYTLRELNVYKVEGDFPRITEKDIRNGVGDVHYTVSVAECRHFRVPLDDLVTLLKE